MIGSTTGTSIESYLNWVKKELERKDYGEISITFTVHSHQVVDVKKTSVDNEHYPLKKQGT